MIVDPNLLEIVLWSSAAAATVFSVIRRSFRTTSPGHFSLHFNRNGGSEVAEGERLQRIELLTSILCLLSRSAWAGALTMLRYQVTAWYLPAPLESYWLVGLFVEALVTGLILFELIPQTIAVWRGAKVASALIPFLDKVELLLSPVTRSFRGIRRVMLRILGTDVDRSEQVRAAEGIRAAVEIGEREGLLQPGEKSMIESVLEFHDADVVEVMTPRTDMVCFEASETIENVIPKAIACGHSRIPVYRKDVDEIIGVLYVKDLLRHAGDSAQHNLPVEKAIRKTHFVPETKMIRELLREFRTERFHIAVVLDEYGGTSGLITIEDILEEIVGEIEDEYDAKALSSIRRINGSTFDLDGRASIWDVKKTIGISIPDSDDYETVAGFLFSSLGRVPKEGDFFEHDGLRFQITSADERKIKRVRVHLLHAPQQGGE
ncbi:MAG TPA: HlyC/CorC family transporter [Planctomycetes bacterium]|nr:HlyC/CorC family transporter [Planctomycetota bacterium]HIN80968.1 HlyC/CorC family transporter [Planctomycetota bacterium]